MSLSAFFELYCGWMKYSADSKENSISSFSSEITIEGSIILRINEIQSKCQIFIFSQPILDHQRSFLLDYFFPNFLRYSGQPW